MIHPSRVSRLARLSLTPARLAQPTKQPRSSLGSLATAANCNNNKNNTNNILQNQFECANRKKNIAVSNTSHCRRLLHGTPAVRHLVNKDFEKAMPTEEEQSETEETVPIWQNPLHHNNPDMKKIFEEDFDDGEEMPIIPLPPLSTDDPDKVVAPPHLHELAHEIVNLTLLEMKELTSQIADHFGFDDAAFASSYGGGDFVDGAGGGDGAAEAEAVVEEKTVFDIKLVGFDAKAKIKVIKEVRSIGGLGLKEAKELVESSPKIIQKDLKKEKAEELKAQLEAVGAQVEIE